MQETIIKGFILFCGLFTLICANRKPPWYWEHHKARKLRDLLGDRGAEIFYYCLGLFLVAMWAMTIFI